MKNIYIVLILMGVVGGLIFYSAMQFQDGKHEDYKRSSVNEINTLKAEVQKVKVQKIESEAVESFEIKKVDIIKKSDETKNYTKKMMEDKDVKSFTDSF